METCRKLSGKATRAATIGSTPEVEAYDDGRPTAADEASGTASKARSATERSKHGSGAPEEEVLSVRDALATAGRGRGGSTTSDDEESAPDKKVAEDEPARGAIRGEAGWPVLDCLHSRRHE